MPASDRTYKHIVIGGTFDGLHKGHEFILTTTFDSARQVTIGLTSEAYIRRFKKGKGVAPFSKRYQALTKWLRNKHVAERTTIVPLDNKWGPAILADSFDAIAVTRDNKHVAREINTLRKERGLPALELLEIALLNAEDLEPISSTRMRAEEIDKEGHLLLPDSLRPELQKPLGRVLVGLDAPMSFEKHKEDIVITVGDVTTKSILAFGIRPSLAVIDLQVERKPFQTLDEFAFSADSVIVRVQSGPGYISWDARDVVRRWSVLLKKRKHTVILVDGEEDLLTLPAILYAPNGSMLYYGSPPSSGVLGLVEVTVDDEVKKRVGEFMKRFARDP